MTMIIIAFFPPWWHRTMDPLLEKWDSEYASANERALVGA